MPTNYPDSPSDVESDKHIMESAIASTAAPPVESLVAGRVRRSTAGNLLAKLLTQEADDEDTLFLEDEDDEEFEVKVRDDLSDVQLESSSEDDDPGPPEAGSKEDLEGERALLQAEREERKAKKRKASEAFFKARPKRATISEQQRTDALATDSPATSTAGDYTALTRPRKKSERISWVPEFVATRVSSRTLSLQNRTETMRRLEESEKRRKHTIALMEAAAAKKEKVRQSKGMTQEERLAEAKITERRNRKSLNSWEETEKAKLEEQRRRLAALQNRKLSGPVITYWSGAAEWDKNGRLIKVGKSGLIMEAGDGSNKRKKVKAKLAEAPSTPESSAGLSKREAVGEHSGSPTRSTTPTAPPPPTPRIQSSLVKDFVPPLLEGILEYTAPTGGALQDEARLEKEEMPQLSSRNTIILENFQNEDARDAKGLMKTLWGEQVKRNPTAKPICVIAHQPARFRDPATGMPYSSLYAYREIRRILRGDIQWSSLLGAFVGELEPAARGVPEGFNRI